MTNIDKHFIRALTTVVVDFAITPKTYLLNDNNFKKGIVLLNRYIDNKEHLEVECQIAIQILINKLEHPSGKSYCVHNVCLCCVEKQYNAAKIRPFTCSISKKK